MLTLLKLNKHSSNQAFFKPAKKGNKIIGTKKKEYWIVHPFEKKNSSSIEQNTWGRPCPLK